MSNNFDFFFIIVVVFYYYVVVVGGAVCLFIPCKNLLPYQSFNLLFSIFNSKSSPPDGDRSPQAQPAAVQGAEGKV